MKDDIACMCERILVVEIILFELPDTGILLDNYFLFLLHHLYKLPFEFGYLRVPLFNLCVFLVKLKFCTHFVIFVAILQRIEEKLRNRVFHHSTHAATSFSSSRSLYSPM